MVSTIQVSRNIDQFLKDKTNFNDTVSSVKAIIEVLSGREGTFRVKCTSSGGKTFTMDVEGPGYSGEEQGQMRVEAVGDPQRMGNDTYSATTSVISGGCNGDTYQCTASNGAAPGQSHNVTLKGSELDYHCFHTIQKPCLRYNI